MNIWTKLRLLFICALTCPSAYASEAKIITDLQQRIQELEESYFDLEERVGREGFVRPALSSKFTLGGFYQGVYHHYESNNSKANGLDLNVIYLTGEGKLADRWTVKFAHLIGSYPTLTNYVTSSGGIDVSKLSSNSIETNVSLYANIAYQHSDAMRLTFGRQRSQVGIVPRELYPLSFVYSSIPEYAAQDTGSGSIIPMFMDGFTVSGRWFTGEQSILYYSVTGGSVSNVEPTATSTNGLVRAFNSSAYTGRLAYGLADQMFEIGLNYINAQRNKRTLSIPAFVFPSGTPGIPPEGINIITGGERFDVVGLDVYVNTDSFQLKAEYYSSSEKVEKGRMAYFVQPVWLINKKWELFYRNEVTKVPPLEAYANSPFAPILSSPNFNITPHTYPFIGETQVNTVGFRYKPMDNVHLKFGTGEKVFKDLPQGEQKLRFSYLSVVAGF